MNNKIKKPYRNGTPMCEKAQKLSDGLKRYRRMQYTPMLSSKRYITARGIPCKIQNKNCASLFTLLNQKVYFNASPVYSTIRFSYKTEGRNTLLLVLLIPNKTSAFIPQ